VPAILLGHAFFAHPPLFLLFTTSLPPLFHDALTCFDRRESSRTRFLYILFLLLPFCFFFSSISRYFLALCLQSPRHGSFFHLSQPPRPVSSSLEADLPALLLPFPDSRSVVLTQSALSLTPESEWVLFLLFFHSPFVSSSRTGCSQSSSIIFCLYDHGPPRSSIEFVPLRLSPSFEGFIDRLLRCLSSFSCFSPPDPNAIIVDDGS